MRAGAAGARRTSLALALALVLVAVVAATANDEERFIGWLGESHGGQEVRSLHMAVVIQMEKEKL